MRELLLDAIYAALKAGRAVLDIYETDFEVYHKKDLSPLTEADKASHKILKTHLPKYPVISEEGKDIPYEERKSWDKFWLIDPLDGTKEFIKRNGEFAINIALIEKGEPVLGVIYAPVVDLIYYGTPEGSYRIIASPLLNKLEQNMSRQELDGLLREGSQKLPLPSDRSRIVVVASRSHLDDETAKFIAKLEKRFGAVEMASKGSSLKLCLVAAGLADVYPRLAPTSEWDIAAGDAIIRYSGGWVVSYPKLKPLVYNKESLINPKFIATRIPPEVLAEL